MKLWTVDADAAPSEPVRKVIQFTFFHCKLPIGNTEILTVSKPFTDSLSHHNFCMVNARNVMQNSAVSIVGQQFI